MSLSLTRFALAAASIIWLPRISAGHRKTDLTCVGWITLFVPYQTPLSQRLEQRNSNIIDWKFVASMNWPRKIYWLRDE